MIAARAEARLLDLAADADTHELSFTFAVGNYFKDSVTLKLRERPGIASLLDGYWLEAGEKGVRILGWPRA